ncbi:hypothetical protein G9P44_004135 [Scheffersomyces stipitis]|nr:hypothetical protein G9P44_004135 [Scheffersomyces stipitis]
MPIKSLESYLFERKLANSSSIEILQNATIGIDVEHYLSRVYTFKKEQFLAGIGGVPSSLKDYIQSDLQVFQEFNIKPIFVISGLHIQLQTADYKTNELSPQEQHLEATWTKIGSKQPYSFNNIESFRLFTDPLLLRPIVNDLIKYFIEIGIDYMIAPYDASFQLSYLYQNQVIDSIYGSTDLLLTKIDKFILGMEFQSKDFRFIDKHKVLSELNLTERQFLDLSLMVGCNIQPTTFSNFPPLPKPNPVQPYPQLSYFKLGLDIIYQYNSFNGGNTSDLHGYIANLNDPKLLDLYYKGHAAIRFLPILNKAGYVELYSVEMAKLGLEDNSEFVFSDDEEEELSDGVAAADKKEPSETHKTVKVPTDIHEIVSQRLPPELYFYQSIGLLPIELLQSITKGQLDIRPSLESGLSDSYKKLITSSFYNDNLDHQINLITQLLARYYQVKKIRVKYWYKDEVIELNNRITPPIFKRVDKLFIQNDSSTETFKFVDFFKKLSEKGEGKYTTTKEVKTRDDIVSTVLLRTLYLFNIVDNNTRDLNTIGRILKKFVEQHGKNTSETDMQHLFLVVLLINSKTLNLREPNREFSNVPKFFKDYNSKSGGNIELSSDEQKHITLISRIFSLHKLNVAPINYQGPISRNLLNFRSHIKFICNNLINTIECLLVDFIVHQENNNLKTNYDAKNDWYKLVDQLPFYKDVNNTLLGVVAEIYFEYAARQTKAGATVKEDIVKNTKDHLLNHVYQINTPSFNINVNGVNSFSANQLLGDIDSGVEFWNMFVALAKIINEEDKTLLNDDYYEGIVSTDEFLKSYV